jgi:hypothetical protein
VNVTVTQPEGAGPLVLSPGNEPAPPTVISISFAKGQTRASNLILRLASDGSGTISVQNYSGGTAHFILDVSGYFE